MDECLLSEVKRTDADVTECPLVTQSGHEQLRIAAVQTDPEAHFAGRKSLV
jgi:hypothetical protein